MVTNWCALSQEASPTHHRQLCAGPLLEYLLKIVLSAAAVVDQRLLEIVKHEGFGHFQDLELVCSVALKIYRGICLRHRALLNVVPSS